jgi:hypothetical protein
LSTSIHLDLEKFAANVEVAAILIFRILFGLVDAMQYNKIASGFTAFLTVAGVVTIAPIALAQATLNEWRFDPTANQLEVTVEEGVKPRYFVLAQPPRIVLDLPDTALGNAKTQQSYSGSIREIRVSQFQPGLTRFVLELAPGAKLAPGQVKLEPGGGSKTGQQWMLRPLLVAQVQPAGTTPLPIRTESPAPNSQAEKIETSIAPPAPEPAPSNSEVALPPEQIVGVTIAEPAPIPQPTVSVPTSPSIAPAPTDADLAESLPSSAASPAATGVTPQEKRPIEANSSPKTAPTVNVITPLPPDTVTVAVPESPKPATEAAPESVKLSQATPSLENPALPPATFSNDQAPTVTVPPLSPSTPSTGEMPASTPLPPTSFPAPEAGTVTVPPLRVNSGVATPTVPPTPGTTEPSVIEFGQPLPGNRSSNPTNANRTNDPNYAYNPSPNVLLPAGSFLNLSYPGETALNLKPGEPKQEVLVLQTEIRDWQGNLVAPVGTAVIGRFEANNSGNRFVAQAIALGTRNLPLAAESGSLGGNRQVSENRLLLNSGIGALAGAIIGGFSGLDAVGGAAAGAAVTYVTTPRSAAIQPGQVLQVRLTEDLNNY